MKGLLLLSATTGTPLDPPDFSPFWQRYFASRNETILVLSAIGGVVLIVVFWAVFFRKRIDKDARRYSYDGNRGGSSPSKPQSSAAPNGSNSQTSQGKRRRRRRRRPHRPRNPTLSEAGGLPPVRADQFTDDPP
jgi:hypothetical protein